MALQGIEVEGVIIKEYPAKEGVSQRTGNAWKSQEFVIQTKDQYPRACLFRVFGADKLEQFNIHQGDTVHVWLDINAFRVDHVDPNAVGGASMAAPMSQLGGQASVAPTAGATSTAAPAAPAQDNGDAADDLPF